MAHFDSCEHPPIWIIPRMPAATVAKVIFQGYFTAQFLNEAGAVGMTNYATLQASRGSYAIRFTASVLFIQVVIIS